VLGERPETVIGDDAPVPVMPPGLEVAVKDVATGPVAEGVKATVAVEEPVVVAVPIVGASGAKYPLRAEAVIPRIGIKTDLRSKSRYLLQFLPEFLQTIVSVVWYQFH
jgi:hypothetical protein